MGKTRQYKRKVSNTELKSLKMLYEGHITMPKGFLSPREKRLLLSEAPLPRTLNESDFWYKIKIRARNALIDLLVLSKISSDKLLQEVLHKEFKSSISLGEPPLSLWLKTLFPTAHAAQTLSKDEWEWRAKILQEVVGIGLEWYMKSGSLKSEVQRRTLKDALDIISTASSGESWEEIKRRRREFAEAL